MKIIKSTYISLAGYVENLARQIENHDSLSRAAIEEMGDKVAKARVRLAALKKEREKVEIAIKKAEEKMQDWEARAIKSHKEDKEKALECLKRKKNKTTETEQLKEQLKYYTEAEINIEKDLQTLNTKLQSLKNKRKIFLAREAKSSAFAVANECNASVSSGIEDIFDSWELKIAKDEVNVDSEFSDHDSLEEEFVKEEEKAELESELDKLVSSK